MPSAPSSAGPPALPKRFPTALILAPPLLSALFVGAFRLIMSGRDGLDVRSTTFAVLMMGMVAVLWLGPLLELIVLPIGVARLWRDASQRTALRLGAVALGIAYLGWFAYWLIGKYA